MSFEALDTTDQQNPPSVLIVDLAVGYGGVDVRVVDTAQALAEAGWKSAVAVMEGSPIHDILRERHLDVLPLPYRNKFNPAIGRVLTAEIKRQGFTVIDGHNVQSWLWSGQAARATGIGLVTSAHLPSRRIPGGWRGWFEQQLIQRNKRYGSRFMTVSGEIRDWLCSLGIKPDDIALSYNAVDQALLRTEAEPLDIRAEAGWPEDAHVAVIIGRLNIQKGHDFLFEAMGRLKDSQPRLHCAVVGDGRESHKLKEQVEREGLQGRVHFAGFRQDIPSWLAAADSFMLPSRAEGLPYAMLEASAFSLPMLASRADAIEELFSHRENVWMVDVGDISGIAEGLSFMLDQPDEARKIGKAAHDFVAGRLDLATMTQESLDLYTLVSREARC